MCFSIPELLLGSGNRWFYVKLINHAGGRARIVSDQILPATTLDVDESQVEYARLEPGDEYKRIVLRAVDVKNKEPLQLNGEYTLGLRPDDSGDVARVKITRGGNFQLIFTSNTLTSAALIYKC